MSNVVLKSDKAHHSGSFQLLERSRQQILLFEKLDAWEPKVDRQHVVDEVFEVKQPLVHLFTASQLNEHHVRLFQQLLSGLLDSLPYQLAVAGELFVALLVDEVCTPVLDRRFEFFRHLHEFLDGFLHQIVEQKRQLERFWSLKHFFHQFEIKVRLLEF